MNIRRLIAATKLHLPRITRLAAVIITPIPTPIRLQKSLRIHRTINIVVSASYSLSR
jgi:hypothetical protein